MKFGLWYAAVGPLVEPGTAVRLAQTAEAAGFESMWTGDHVAVPTHYESRYPYSDTPMAPGPTWVPTTAPTCVR